MAIPPKKVSPAESLATISNVLLSAFIISTLYFGRELLVPLALAALLTFMLAPLVTRLQRWLGRVGAVLFVVAMMFAATGAAGWVLTRQAVDLANQLPGYKENIRTKLRSIQVPDEGPFSKISRTLDELKKDLPGAEGNESRLKTDEMKDPEQKPMPVEVVSGKDERVQFVQEVLAPVLGPLGTAGLVLLLLIFMLLQREDLRNRMIRLIGQGRISATSRAMDDAGFRVSKYLFMQLVVNVTYGIPVAIGLYFIGVPNAILWGALSTVLRFIPYVGPWIAAAFPILLSLAVSPDWMAPALTVGLFVLLELFSNNVMEPWLYGSSTGVTPIALIVAALVWTWLWGPVGLVLATPLTVCLVVMGRHIPRLAFLSIVLSDEEPLTPAEDCYHRLHRAGEHDEMELVDTYLKNNSQASLFDSVLIPVITAAETDHRLGLLETEQLDFIESGLSDILDELELREEAAPVTPEIDAEASIACVPARAYRDQLAGEMLVRLLRQSGHPARNASSKMVSGELVGWVRETKASVVCISVVAPTSISQARYLTSKLRSGFPDLKIIVGLWGNPEKASDPSTLLRDSGADEVVTTVAEAVERATVNLPRPLITE
ncbi:MAG: AI-2E family transporter [Verrucomicrobiota bacterium]